MNHPIQIHTSLIAGIRMSTHIQMPIKFCPCLDIILQDLDSSSWMNRNGYIRIKKLDQSFYFINSIVLISISIKETISLSMIIIHRNKSILSNLEKFSLSTTSKIENIILWLFGQCCNSIELSIFSLHISDNIYKTPSNLFIDIIIKIRINSFYF